MQEMQLQKLKNMVKTSSVLSPAERTEWLALVDLMNEKQLLELERILRIPEIKKKDEQLSQGLTLSHIVNFPKTSPGSRPQPRSSPPSQTQSQPVSSTPAVRSRPPVKFEDQLRTMLSEKELPAAPQPIELAPPGGELKPKTSPQPPQVPLAPAANARQNQLQVGPVKISAKKVLGEDVIGDVQPQAQQVSGEQTKAFKAGLQNSNILLNAKLQQQREEERKQEALQRKVEEARPSLPELKKSAPLSAKVESLQDVAGLSVRVWKQQEHEGLKKRLLDLIADHNYHDVIFNLNKSPLYNAYINTGLQLLKNEISFEELPEQETSLEDNYMTREEFEQFTDLLRQVQAGA